MGRKKIEEETETISEKDEQKKLDSALEIIDEINPDAAFLDDESLSNVRDWIDTGCYALNAIISGSLFGGIPCGRVTGLVGLSGTGKTLIMNKIMANAISKGYKPLYFDTENALDSLTASRLGCDISKIKHMPIEFVEDCKIQIVTILTKLIEANLKRKVIIFIDSLGNLNTKKDLDDSLENKSASDMGLKAKLIGSMLKLITTRAAKAEVPVVFSNHLYTSPTEMYPSIIKTQSGGLKPVYISSVVLQLSTTNEKIEKNDDKTVSSSMSNKISGMNLKAMTTKNRFVVPFLEANMYLNYKTGLSKYKGLLEMAVACGMIAKSGPAYVMGDKKIGYASTFEDNPEFWNDETLQKLDNLIKSELSYSNETIKQLTEQVGNV